MLFKVDCAIDVPTLVPVCACATWTGSGGGGGCGLDFPIVCFLCDPAGRIAREKPVGHGITRRQGVGMIAFFLESEAAEEGPGGLVRGLGDGGDAPAPQLDEGIAQDRADGARRGPTRRRCDERHLDIGWPPVAVDRGRDDFALVRDADRGTWPEVGDAEPLTGPSCERAVMAEYKHVTATAPARI